MENSVKAIKGGRLIDGTGGTPIEAAVVLIEATKIVQVGKEKAVKIPGGAEVIDASGKTVMPGLMDLHVHLGEIIDPLDQKLKLHIHSSYMKHPPHMKVLHAAKNAREALEAGFTTVRECGGGDGVPWPFSLKRAIEIGLVPGPRYLTPAVELVPTAGAFDLWTQGITGSVRSDTADGPWEIRKRVRELVREGADFIKTVADVDPTLSLLGDTYCLYTLEELKAAVEEAHNLGRKVDVHAITAAGIKNAILAGADLIEHGQYLKDVEDDLIKMMKGKNIIFIPTLTGYLKGLASPETMPGTWLEWSKSMSESHVASFKRAHHAGIKIAVGTDLWTTKKKAKSAEELEFFVQFGMSEMEAIVAATKTCAEGLGLEDHLGTIESGKLADIIIVEGDPLKNVKILQEKERIRMVIQNGDIVVNRGI